MSKQSTPAADIFRAAIGVIFVTMTMAFVTLPYALSAHPGDSLPKLATAASHHLS